MERSDARLQLIIEQGKHPKQLESILHELIEKLNIAGTLELPPSAQKGSD